LAQPKKPVGGAYGIFLSEKRPEFAKKCVGQKASAVSKLAGDSWKKLSEAQKAPYQKQYEVVKAAFDKEMAAFLAAGGEKTKGVLAQRSEKRKAKEGKKAKDPNAPKKPTGGGYGVFLSENREKIVKSLPAGHAMTDVAKAAGQQWGKLSDSAKKPYQDKFAKKQAEYAAALEEYKKNLPADADEDEDEEEEEEEEDEQPIRKKICKAGA